MLDILTTFFVVLFTALGLFELYIRLSTYRMSQCVKNMPRMLRLPIIGNVLETGSITPDSHAIFKTLYRKQKELGPVYQGWLGPYLYIIVSHPKVIQAVLNSKNLLEKGSIYNFLKSWLGKGILISKGDETWRLHRKLVTPAFHFNVLEKFLVIFNNHANKIVEKLEKHVDGPEVNITNYMLQYTLESICETAMGIRIGVLDNDDSEYSRAVINYTNVFMKRSMQPWLYFDFIFKFSKLSQMERDCLKVLHETAEKVIQQKKAEYLSHLVSNNENKEAQEKISKGDKKSQSVMDILLTATFENNLMTDKDILDEVNNFMFAGQDSTSAASYFTIYNLAHNEDIQQRVYEEQICVFGDSMRDCKMADIYEMKYLDMVIKETLRMFPPVPMIIRKITEDLKVDEYHLPKGSNVVISIYNMQNDPRVYPNPMQFNPERFLPDEKDSDFDAHKYIPFSIGPRNCLGMKYALLEIKALVSKVIRKYKLLPGSTKTSIDHLTAEVVLRAKDGMMIKFSRRKELFI